MYSRLAKRARNSADIFQKYNSLFTKHNARRKSSLRHAQAMHKEEYEKFNANFLIQQRKYNLDYVVFKRETPYYTEYRAKALFESFALRYKDDTILNGHTWQVHAIVRDCCRVI